MLNISAGGRDGDVVGLRCVAEEAVVRAATGEACCHDSTSEQNQHHEDVPSRCASTSTHPLSACQWQQEQAESDGCGVSLQLVHGNDGSCLNAEVDGGWTSVGCNRRGREG